MWMFSIASLLLRGATVNPARHHFCRRLGQNGRAGDKGRSDDGNKKAGPKAGSCKPLETSGLNGRGEDSNLRPLPPEDRDSVKSGGNPCFCVECAAIRARQIAGFEWGFASR
jgi:hypothetical protein